jgi:hypothetical protein
MSHTSIPSETFSRLGGAVSEPAFVDVRIDAGARTVFRGRDCDLPLERGDVRGSGGLLNLRRPASLAKHHLTEGRRRRDIRIWAGLKPGERIMWTRNISRTILCLALLGIISSAHALTQQELIAKLEAAGYTQVTDIKSTAEGTAAKAIKDGKAVRLVVDSSGQIKEQK